MAIRAEELIVELLRSGSGVRMEVRGDSMVPTLLDGDRVVIEPLVTTPRSGDVVLAILPRGLTIHRVRRAGADGGCILIGDNARVDDPPVALQQVIGRVTLAERDGRLLRVDSTLQKLVARARRWARRFL